MANEQNTNLVPSLKESLLKPLGDTTIDIGEVFFDTIFQDGIIKDIPIIRTIATFTKVGLSLRERNLAKNTYAFIMGFRNKTLSTDKINSYRERLSDPKVAEKELGYALVLLDKEIHYQKAGILGKAYRAFADGDITWDEYIEISEVINRMFMIDFKHLYRIAKGSPLNYGIREEEMYGLQRLEGMGLISEIKPHVTGTTIVLNGGYKLTSLGIRIINIDNNP